MPFVTWDDSFDVGVTEFNRDHRRLVTLINELHNGMVSGIVIAEMTYILDGLVDYTRTHFRREEELMKEYAYPGYRAHRREHYDLMVQVADFQGRLREGKAAFTIELMSFLRDWLVRHIKGTDMGYRDFFLARGAGSHEGRFPRPPAPR